MGVNGIRLSCVIECGGLWCVVVYLVIVMLLFFLLMRRRPPRSTQSRSSAASDVYKRQVQAVRFD